MKKLKRGICYLLMFALLLGTWGIQDAQAADNVSVSGATYPDWIKKGSVFILKGTVQASSPILELEASLRDGHNNVMYAKTVRPNSTRYDLKGIDSAMYFNKLSANPYTYQVTVRTASGTYPVIMKPFTVYSGSKPSFATELDTSAKYRLCVKENSNMVADIAGTGSGSNVLVKNDSGQSSANWYLEYAGNSAYMIKNAATGLYLDVAGGAYRNGTNVQLWTGNRSEAQQWYFIPDGNAYKIISKNNYLTLSLENSLSLNKPNVQMWRDLGVAHQRFILKKVGSPSQPPKKVTKILSVPHWYMKDSRWKNVKIGNSTIGKIGCVVCSIAEVESYMRGGNVYPSQIKKEYKFDKNGNIYWGSKYKSGGTPYLTDIYNSIVYDNRPVIAKLSSREHWIVIMGVENVGFTAQGKPDLYPSNFIVQDAGTTKAKKRLSDYGMKNYKGLSRMMIRK